MFHLKLDFTQTGHFLFFSFCQIKTSILVLKDKQAEAELGQAQVKFEVIVEVGVEDR